MSNTVNYRTSVTLPKINGSSSIPRKQSLGRQYSNPNSPSKIPVNNPEAHKWKNKFEEAEQRRKCLLTEKEKLLRSHNDLQKKYLDLQTKHECLETELFEKNEEFTKLSTASRSLYQEYETIKHQYETETGAMSRALKEASQWYKENKELKRKTMLLMDKDYVDSVDEGVDTGEGVGDSDIENLNKTIKQLSAEVAELQTELDSVKHAEFLTSEQNTKLSEELECERQLTRNLENQLEELRKEHEQILRVSEIMKKELQDLKKSEENQRNSVVILRREADGYKKERNVLAHQSTILLQGFNENSGEDSLILFNEIDKLKNALEDERNKHEEELSSLQEKLEEQENNSHVEILEERLKLVESELQAAIARAEKAEEALKAPPAPPPPPPPPMIPTQTPVVPLRVKRRSRVNITELAETIGVPDCPQESKKPVVGVTEDIINEIKQGKFTLKKSKNDNKKEKETPKAVSEILNILGSLRRAPKKRQSVYMDDVQL